MRKGIPLLLSAGLLAAAGSCDLVKHRDVRRVSIRYCDTDSSNQWGARRHLLSETALQYEEAFPAHPKHPQMPYGPGRLANYQVDRIFVDWPKATVRIRARFDLPSDIPALGERAPVSEDGWHTVRIYLSREHNLWKVDELATKKQWISIVVGETYGDAWVELVTGQSP